jgi:hypothetical protein
VIKKTALSDGIFGYQKTQKQFGYIFGGPLLGKFEYILWPFGILYCHLVHLIYGRLV